MNRHILPALLLCALSVSASLPPARAGGAINKCVDSAGRVTLTDQACDANTVSSTVAVPGMQDDLPLTSQDAPAGRMVPVRPARSLPAAGPHVALAGDIATLRQARLQMLMQDAAPRSRVATLHL